MGERVLVVDDDAAAGRALLRLVRPHGDAVLVTSIAQAKPALGSESWRAAIIDVGLPDGCGLDLIEWIRTIRPLTPVLVLSGRCDPEVVNRAFDLAAEYVVKPLVADRLTRFLGGAARPRASREARVAAIVEAMSLAFALTASEADMLRRSAMGQSRDDIARERGSSAKTVKTQITRMLAKTGHGSLTAALAEVLRLESE